MNAKKMSVSAAIAACMSVFTAAATTYYVVPAGTEGNTPTAPYDTWETAANEPALAVAQATSANDVVLVKKGSYAVTQQMTIAAGNVTIKSYDPATGETTAPEDTVFDLSGISDGYGIYATSKSKPKVAGFTFKNKTGSKSAVCFNYSAFTVQDCCFTNNMGSAEGMALYAFLCGGGLATNCTFFCNETTNSSGGAIYTQQNESAGEYVTLRNCTFRKNYVRSNNNGGAVFASRCMHLHDCWFEDNGVTVNGTSATGVAGHLYVGLTPYVSGCTFTGTAIAEYGSALALRPESSKHARGVVTNCTFKNLTHAAGSYGLVHMNGVGADFRDCVFEGITTSRSIFFTESTSGAYIRNCLFKPISGSGIKAVLMTHNSGLVRFENCTIANDSNTICYNNASKSSNEWVNCVLYGTKPTATSAHYQIYDHCIFGDPGFVAYSKGDYRLRSTSSGVDGATPLDWHTGAQDIRNRARVVGAAPDIGAYERQTDDLDFFSIVRVVATAAEKTGEWADAYTDIQSAVNAAEDEALVWVKSGTYALAKNVVVSNRTLTIWSCNPATREIDTAGTVIDGDEAVRAMIIHHGPEGSSYFPVEQHAVEVSGFTFRDCKTATGDGQDYAGEGGAVWMRGTAKSSGMSPSVVKNCRFENCSAEKGGGAWMIGGALVDCVLTNCVATSGNGGGALLAYSSTSSNRADARNAARAPHYYWGTFIGCTFDHCKAASGSGGGLRPGDGSQNAVVYDCTFLSCSAKNYGGSSGAYYSRFDGCFFVGCSGSSGGTLGTGERMNVRNTVVTGNSGGYGAVFGTGGATFTDCIFTNNDNAVLYGAHNLNHCLIANNSNIAFNMYNGDALIVNSTLVNNGEAGITSSHKETRRAYVVNSIVTGNKADYSFSSGGGLSATNSLFQSTHAAASNIAFTDCFFARKPGFRNAAARDYTLRPTAFAREKGLVRDYTSASTDLLGNPRLVNRRGVANAPNALPDLGCFEAQDPVPATCAVYLK